MTTNEAAEFLGMAPGSLRVMRARGTGPKFHKVQGSGNRPYSVFYRRSELRKYAEEVKKTPKLRKRIWQQKPRRMPKWLEG